MVYYDVARPALDALSFEQSGMLFKAMVDYAQFGEIPEVSDPLVSVLFNMIRPKIDHDAEKYRRTCEQNSYNRYCGEEKRHEREPLSFDDWQSNRQRPSTSVNVRDQLQPQPKPQPKPQPNYNKTEDENRKGAAAGKGCGGNNAAITKLRDFRLDGSEEYHPPDEQDFNRRRAEAIEMLQEGGR